MIDCHCAYAVDAAQYQQRIDVPSAMAVSRNPQVVLFRRCRVVAGATFGGHLGTPPQGGYSMSGRVKGCVQEHTLGSP
jgi:hypothetical protein